MYYDTVSVNLKPSTCGILETSCVSLVCALSKRDPYNTMSQTTVGKLDKANIFTLLLVMAETSKSAPWSTQTKHIPDCTTLVACPSTFVFRSDCDLSEKKSLPLCAKILRHPKTINFRLYIQMEN